MTWKKKPAQAKAASTSVEFAHVRLRAIVDRSYFALALTALVPCETPGLGTFAIDKWGRLYYDPQKLAEWGIESSAAVLYHELGHWLRDHFSRFDPIVQGAECVACAAHIANLAQDCAINDDLLAESLKLPGDCATPQKLGLQPGKLEEEYYTELMEQVRKQSGGNSGKQDAAGAGGVGSGGGGGDGKKLCDRHKPIHIKVNCGSGAHGVVQPWEEPGPDDSDQGKGESDQKPGISQAEADMIRREVAREIQRQASSGIGNVPAGWKRWAERFLTPPQVPWERELAALVRNAMVMAAGCSDYSYSKPARRGLWNGVVMPSLRRPKPEAVVVLDTSGSMGEYEITACLSEVEGILKACGQRSVPVICCDAAAAAAQRVSNALQVEVIGAGGTDMGVGIAAAQKLHADVIIVLTDGGTAWPELPPKGSHLVIGLVGETFDIPTPAYAKRTVKIKPTRKDAA